MIDINTRDGIKDERVVADALFGTLYAELHRLARRELNRRGPVGGLGVTTLLHEAYISISAKEGTVFADEARFMGYAPRVMRGPVPYEPVVWARTKLPGTAALSLSGK